jgi:hypothetical protein
LRSLILLAEVGSKKAKPPGEEDLDLDAPPEAKKRPKGKGAKADDKPEDETEDDTDALPPDEDADEKPAPVDQKAKRFKDREKSDLDVGEGVDDTAPGEVPDRPKAVEGDEGGEDEGAVDPEDDMDDEDPDPVTDIDPSNASDEGDDGSDPSAEPGAAADDPVQAAVKRERLYDALEEVEDQANELAKCATDCAASAQEASMRNFASRARDLADECARQVAVTRERFADLGYDRARDVYTSARERVGAVAELLKHVIDKAQCDEDPRDGN